MKKKIWIISLVLSFMFLLNMQCMCDTVDSASTNANKTAITTEKEITVSKKYGPGRFVSIVEKNTGKDAECKSLKKLEDENGHEAYEIDIISDSSSNGKWKLVVYKNNEKYEAPKGTYWFTYYDDKMKKVGTCVAKKVK